jgi:hypothetical protein
MEDHNTLTKTQAKLNITKDASNHSIDPNMINSHLDGWKITTLSQRHKPNSISQRMQDLYETHDYMGKHN